MPQAKITVNAVVGSSLALPINVSVSLDNQNIGGEASYNWTILDQPPGALDALSALTVQNPTFTPKKEGSYLLRLVVNQGLSTEQEDRVVCAIAQLKTGERIPAAGETTEADTSDGWATSQNSLLRRVDTLLSDPGIIIGVNTSGAILTRGEIVRTTSAAIIKSTLPGQETLPGFALAHANVLAEIDELLCVVEGTVAGATTVPAGGSTEARLMKVRYIGRLASLTPGGVAVVGDTVYVNDAGALSLTVGTIRRRVGSAMTAGATFDVWFNGVGGADIDLTPIDRRYVVWGNPGSLTNGFRVDGETNAASVSGGLPFTIKTSDDVTKTFVLRRNTVSGLAIQEWQTQAGAVLASVAASGALTIASGGLFVTAGNVLVGATGVSVAAGAEILQQPGATQFSVSNSDVWLSSRDVNLSNTADTLDAYFRLQTASDERGIRFFFETSFGVAEHALYSHDEESFLEINAPAGGRLELGVSGADANVLASGSIFIYAGGAARWQITSTGVLTSSGGPRAIQSVLDPVTTQDAATKNYVDQYVVPQNCCINGRMDFFQRAVTTAFSGASTVNTYVADRWLYFQSTGLATLTRDTSVPVTARYSLKWQRTAADAGLGTRNVAQEIDREYVQMLRGKAVRVSFWAKRGANFSAVSNLLNVYFDTGTGAETQNRYVTGYTGSASPISTTVTLTTTWTQFTVLSTALGTTINTAALIFQANPVGVAGADDSFYVTNVSVMDANATTPVAVTTPYMFAGGSIAGELELCRRYYEKSYEVNTVAGTDMTALNDAGIEVLPISAANLTQAIIKFKVPKRITPVLRIFPLAGGAGGVAAVPGSSGINWRYGDGTFATGATAVFVNSVTSEGAFVDPTGTPTANGKFGGWWSADAEL